MGLQWYGDTVITFDDFFSGQHGIQLLPNGNIVTLDNGKHSKRYPTLDIDERMARALEIEVLVDNDSVYSATTVWSYNLTDELYGAISGNVQKLDNDNYLINTIGNTHGAYSIEVTQNKEVAWKCKYNIATWASAPFYRAMRIPDIKFIVGCEDNSACNYNVDANTDDGSCKYLDCAEVCGGTAVVDCEGVCGGSSSSIPEGNCDCNGNILDECGVCGGAGPNSGYDCAGNQLSIYNGIIPDKFDIISIYPNPFNPVANINFEIVNSDFISGEIYNLNGQLIEILFSEYKSIGSYNIIWNASLYPSGIYLFILGNNSDLLMEKIVLLK